MKTLTVYGSSDDLIETEGLDGCDEFNNPSENCYKGYLLIENSEGRDKIHIRYDGCWSFSWVMGDEDEPMFGVFRNIKPHDNGYSMHLEISYPDDAVLSYVKNK